MSTRAQIVNNNRCSICAVGALCLALICLPPLLLTPLSDRLIGRLTPRLPRWIAGTPCCLSSGGQ